MLLYRSTRYLLILSIRGSTSLCSLSRPFLTIRQNSLNVTVCIIARTSYQGYFIHSLSTLCYYNAPSLATRLTGDYRDRTYTGKCGPASLDTHEEKRLPRGAFFLIHTYNYSKTSECTVLLLTPNAFAVCRTVALCSMIYWAIPIARSSI